MFKKKLVKIYYISIETKYDRYIECTYKLNIINNNNNVLL